MQCAQKTHKSYDAWSLQQFEQYVRDLVVFGTNSIELISASRPGSRGSLMPVDQARLLHKLLNWENPEPGGYYDDLGNSGREPHLVHTKAWSDDPGFLESPQDEFTRGWNDSDGQALTARLSWLDQAQTLYRTPLRMQYSGLDPYASYTLRVLYGGRFQSQMQVFTGSGLELREAKPPESGTGIGIAHLPQPTEYLIPREATRSGSLQIEWRLLQGRGCQVAEVWLVRSPSPGKQAPRQSIAGLKVFSSTPMPIQHPHFKCLYLSSDYTLSGTTKGLRYSRVSIASACGSLTKRMAFGSKFSERPRR